ncbi:hypothetical protein N7519_003146 [Penicillium mononematosum]|uniref:uncharacterized protein n=1 Tax=Penicillium mononematosum TaxID=268346 RepID=UPI00254980E4|nr:uncharacterized protein N7519_003146 [Penicillium mononematosum]KAJ6188238.1 hypothetical protein N7519_003146 [Penicillium mononematosum]
MASISGLANDNTLSPRAEKKYVVDMERELFLAKMLLGFIGVACVVLLGCTLYFTLKPKYEEKWRPKLKPKLRDCKEKYEGWKKKMRRQSQLMWLAIFSQAPDVNRITRDLTPEYMKMSTAAI